MQNFAPYNGKVLVVGAGASGLYAGYLMKARGIHFEILEASARLGGRLAQLEGFASRPLDLGASHIWGRNHLLGDYCLATKIPLQTDTLSITYWFEGQMTSSLPKDPSIFEGDNLPDISFWEYAQQQGFGEEYRWIIEAIAGREGGGAESLSVAWNAWEKRHMSGGREVYRLFQSLYEFYLLQFGLFVMDHVRFNVVVNHIDYSEAKVKVWDTAGQMYEADKVIVTVPVSVLKAGLITFEPALPNFQVEALQKIGMSACVKVLLRFSSRFYHRALWGGAICAAYYDALPDTGEAVVEALAVGAQAEALRDLGSAQSMAASVIDELDQMYSGQASALLQAYHVQDWTSEPFILGGFSYSPVGMGTARSLAAMPLDRRVYFAGEAMNLNGHHQTLHGAMETAAQALVEITQS